jgi:hypothetical protein
MRFEALVHKIKLQKKNKTNADIYSPLPAIAALRWSRKNDNKNGMMTGDVRPVVLESRSWLAHFALNLGRLLSLQAIHTGSDGRKVDYFFRPGCSCEPRWRQTAEKKHGAVFDLAVCLGQRSESDVTLVHGRRSATEYSGSLLP